MKDSTCELCGLVDPSVAFAVMRWRDGTFSAGFRCRDHDACARRVRARGRDWPVLERSGVAA